MKEPQDLTIALTREEFVALAVAPNSNVGTALTGEDVDFVARAAGREPNFFLEIMMSVYIPQIVHFITNGSSLRRIIEEGENHAREVGTGDLLTAAQLLGRRDERYATGLNERIQNRLDQKFGSAPPTSPDDILRRAALIRDEAKTFAIEWRWRLSRGRRGAYPDLALQTFERAAVQCAWVVGVEVETTHAGSFQEDRATKFVRLASALSEVIHNHVIFLTEQFARSERMSARKRARKLPVTLEQINARFSKPVSKKYWRSCLPRT